jgi:hypothetical protein
MNDTDNMVNVKSLILISIGEDISLSEATVQFVQFMENNDWFGMQPQIMNQNGEDEMYFSDKDAANIAEKFSLYLHHQSLSEEEILAIYLEKLGKMFPKTKKHLEIFINSDGNGQLMAAKNINDTLDFFLYYLKDEISRYNDYMIEHLVTCMCEELSIKTGNFILDFLCWMKKHHHVSYSVDFVLKSRNTESRVKQAYNSEKYLALIYYLFSPDYIRENMMYENACENHNTANAWLYLSIHMICALRDTDIVRIPHPRLNKSPEEVLNLTKNGRFTHVDALLTVNSVLWQLKNLPMVPSKTSKHSGISDIKLIIPDSSMIHFGTLFAIVESHRLLNGQQNKPFIRPIKGYEAISRYLGDDIGDLFLDDNFSARSANKSNMQAIEMFADDILDNTEQSLAHAKGYMLAALARSHKGSYGEFAHTTEVYLKDANFSGYSAEFVAKELFERGVCSFIPAMLLKIINGRDYDRLSVTNQTKLIKEVGLTPNEIETLLTCIDSSMDRAKEVVTCLFTKEDNRKSDYILEILHNIGSGYAVSKEGDCLCLMTAMNRICPYSDARQCIGCEYEISTKATAYLLVSEFNRIISLRESTEMEHLKDKYTKLLKDTVLPSLNEIFICIKEQYGTDALMEVEQVIKEAQK